MKISAQQEYGLRCLMQLASHSGPVPLTVGEIAEREGLTAAYVEKILVTLRRAGLVRSLRGAHGGYTLRRTGERISLADVLSSLGQSHPLYKASLHKNDLIEKSFCSRFKGTRSKCVHGSQCPLRPLWTFLGRQLHTILTKVNLKQLTQDAPRSTV
ncbi:MAG TPA: Rrf2 family transcriptional regulator [Elusimicrobiota bacterium]|nr:Rrf2 family transcriptional regulator [Elusimicrobiota bacterium]